MPPIAHRSEDFHNPLAALAALLPLACVLLVAAAALMVSLSERSAPEAPRASTPPARSAQAQPPAQSAGKVLTELAAPGGILSKGVPLLGRAAF